MQHNMSKVLCTEKLTKTYQLEDELIVAVDQVSFDIDSTEFIGLVGPSGSGKTSLLAMIAGLLSPNGGKIILAGKELGQMSESQRTRFRRQSIGFTFQTNNLVSYLNVRENVELMLRLNGRLTPEGKKRAVELLERLGLGNRLRNLPSQLSGGQRQRVAIARSLIHDPELVLADEPTASLDTALAFQVVETFSQLIHEQKRVGIMVTHDLRMCRYVDRVFQMIDGKLARIISDKDEIQKLANTDITHASDRAPASSALPAARPHPPP
jgi:putative ABC transport system ATP-binding protein